MVIGALQSRLMDPALCAEFCEEYIRQRNALRGAKNAAARQAPEPSSPSSPRTASG